MGLDSSLNFLDLLVSFVFLQLKKSLVLNSHKILSLNLLDLVDIVFMQILHFLDMLVKSDLLPINSVLVCLVEISLLSQVLPGRLGLVSDDVSLCKFNLHIFYFLLQLIIFVFHVSYQSDGYIVERAFLLELVPLILKDVQSLVHIELL